MSFFNNQHEEDLQYIYTNIKFTINIYKNTHTYMHI